MLANQFIPNYYKFLRNQTDESALKELVDFFGTIEKVLKLHGDNSFLGDVHVDKPAAADYLVWPWIERSQALKLLNSSKQENFFEDAYNSYFHNLKYLCS